MERLRNKFLNVPVDAVLLPASNSAQNVAKEQKDKATIALRDEQRQLFLSPEEIEQSAATEAPDLSTDDISEPTTDEGLVYVYKPASKGPTWEVRLRLDGLDFTNHQHHGRIFYDQIVEVLLRYEQDEKRRRFFTNIWSH